ncbi:MAG: GNAT family N-acetyltransferase [Muribaculaceae bacterium]|nr:GNAT family N-acetyltransferase [Muribaculaceae bacterium]
MTWEISPYTSEQRETWNAFVAAGRASSFLFDRRYMDYHAPRFRDGSLMARRDGKLMAVLPANITGSTLHSHQGLTYGGWVLAPRGLDTTEVFHLWHRWIEYCREAGITEIDYKPLPTIYSPMPSQEDRYLLALSGATMSACNIASALNLTCKPGLNTLQRRHLRHTPADYRHMAFSGNCPEAVDAFHRMLTACLAERHDARPVHSADELARLMEEFPENIVLWLAYVGGRPAGAVCVYLNPGCVHCQYIATTPAGRDSNILTPLFCDMMAYYKSKGYIYFDFGTSNEDGGRLLNAGLNRQKTSYGASGVAYERWTINVSSALESLPTSLWPAP